VKDCLLTFLNNNKHSYIPVSQRPSYHVVGSNRQRHELGNFVVCGTTFFDSPKELSVSRVYDVRGMWEVAGVAVPDYIASGIDLEIALPRLGLIVPIPGPYGSGK